MIKMGKVHYNKGDMQHCVPIDFRHRKKPKNVHCKWTGKYCPMGEKYIKYIQIPSSIHQHLYKEVSVNEIGIFARKLIYLRHSHR